MRKVTIEFDSLEDREGMLAAVLSQDILIAMHDADNRLRAYQKYSNGTLEEAEKAIEEARDILVGPRELLEG